MTENAGRYPTKAGGHAVNHEKFADDGPLCNHLRAGIHYEKSVGAVEFATAVTIEIFKHQESANILIWDDCLNDLSRRK